MTNSLRCLFVVVLVGAAMSCAGHAAPSAVSSEVFAGRGRVVQVDPGRLEVEIHHERIDAVRGFDGKLVAMESMTMPFAATAAVQLLGLHSGDPVRFEFTVHYEAEPTLRLASIERLPAETPLALP
jgi:Cu/Ag efflux protein CusF